MFECFREALTSSQNHPSALAQFPFHSQSWVVGAVVGKRVETIEHDLAGVGSGRAEGETKAEAK